MSLRHLSLVLFASAICLTASAQTSVTTGVMMGKKYGITYMLPKTQVKVTLKATQRDFTPGEFAAYASRYLHLEGVGMEPSTSYTLDDITMESVGVPDKDNIYFVEMKDKTVAPLMELTKDGIVRSINLPRSEATSSSEEDQEEDAVSNAPSINPRSLFTEEILTASSTAKMAELTAREIYNIRESRNMLLRGEADNMPKDAGQLQIMLDNLGAQEKALLSLFQGVETLKPQAREFLIEPDEQSGTVVARFSKKLGIRDADDLSGEPVYLTLEAVDRQNQPETQADAKGGILKKLTAGSPLSGVAYNVPGRARVTLTYQHEQVESQEIPVTQMGGVEYLSNVLFNKTTTTRVEFNPTTGAILKVDRQ